MNTLPIILGLGAVVLIGSQSSKSSKDSKDSKKIVLKAGSVTIPKNKDPLKCNSTQYMTKDGICQTFWDDKTAARVKTELTIELKGYDSKNWDVMCAQKDKGDGLEMNPNFVKVLSKVIVKLWPEIKLSQLPPTNKSPLYIITLWQKATAVYYDMVCGIADLPPIT